MMRHWKSLEHCVQPIVATIAIFSGCLSVASAQDIKHSVQDSGVETTAAVANSTNSSKIDTYASAVITDYMMIYDGDWAAIELDLYDNGNLIDWNMQDNGFASATTRLSDPINLGDDYDLVPTSAVCFWIPYGEGYWEEYCEPWDSFQFHGILGVPEITSITPNAGTVGTSGTITVSGHNLVDKFSGQASPAITGSGVTLTVQGNPSDKQVGINYSIAQGATIGDQSLTLQDRFGTSNAETFTVGYPPAVVNNVSPAAWTAGQQISVTITGTGFGNSPTLSASGTGVSLTLNSASADGTIIHATATIAINAPSETVTITVQPGYSGSSFRCVCNGQPPNGTNTVTVQPVTPAPQIRMVSNQSELASCQTGSVVSGSSETDVFAGQQMLLCAAPPPTGYSIVNQYWEFENIVDITGGFTNTAGTGAPSAANDGTGGAKEAADPSLTQQGVKFYFVNPGTRETATYHWTLSNGDSAGNQNAADFFIDGPTNVSVTAPENSTTIVQVPNSGVYRYSMGNSASNINGITFTESSTPPSNMPGDNAWFMWVQVLTDRFQYLEPNQNEQCISSDYPANSLDNMYPYAHPITNVGQTTNDSPASSGLGDHSESESSRVFKATTYLMWNPALPSGCTPPNSVALPGGTYLSTPNQGCTSIPIPLGSVSWSTCADAINTLNPAVSASRWALGCSIPQTANNGPNFDTNSGFPTWKTASMTSIIVNQQLQTENKVCSPEPR